MLMPSVWDACNGRVYGMSQHSIYYILVWDRLTEVTPEAQFEMSTRSGTLKDPASYEASAARDETT